MKNQVSCIIPYYNEEKRIGDVLTVVNKVKNITEIIAVDGGSSDRGFEFVQKNFPGVKQIKLPEKLGKTETVKEGVRAARGNYILLLDADLIGLDKTEVERGIEEMFARPEIDLLIFKRTNTPLSSRMIRSDLVFSGERLLRKRDLEEILKLKLTKYQLEIATNKYMSDRHKICYWMQWSTENTPKAEKTDLISGLINDLKMKINVIGYDIIGYHRQILFFCRHEINSNK